MADFLQAALDLLGRPGNAVRGALIAGPGGAVQGLTGERQFDATELPGIRDLPDEGLSLGRLHLTPRTVAGFGAGAALDPLSYIGPGALHGAGSLLESGALDSARPLLSHALPGEARVGFASGADLIPTTKTILNGYSGDAMNDPIEKLIEHANGIAPGHEIVADSPKAATQLTRIDEMTPNPPPSAEVTPVGDQRYAQAKDRLGQKQAELGEVNGKAIPARQWLTETSTGTVDHPAETWEDVIGVPRGTKPDDPLVAERQANPRTLKESEADLSKGPGLTSKYNGETVGFSRQEVMNHLSVLERQIQDLTHQLHGDKGSRFGDPLERRGMENTLSDWQARRQLAADPSLANTERQELERTSTSSRPGLSPKQEQLAQRKAGQRLSRDETFRRAPDSRYYNGGEASLEDEANLPMMERDTRAPHGDPLEEERALRDQADKFGRKGAGTYSSDEELGYDENYRPGGARDVTPDVGVVDHLGRDTATDPRAIPATRIRSSEPTAGLQRQGERPAMEAKPGTVGHNLDIQGELDDIRRQIAQSIRSRMNPSLRPSGGMDLNRFLAYLQQRG